MNVITIQLDEGDIGWKAVAAALQLIAKNKLSPSTGRSMIEERREPE